MIGKIKIPGGPFVGTFTPTEEDTDIAKKLVQSTPVVLFWELNKWLNERGLCISIDTLKNIDDRQKDKT